MLHFAISWFVLGAALLALGIAIYAVGSFAMMRPHAAARTFGVSVRALARETFLAAITQPFLPLYYVVGRRMGPRKGPFESTVPVVLIHGYMQNRICFVGLARALRHKRIGPLYGFNYPWFASIDSNAERLERFVEKVCIETGSPAVDVVCHSMGGLVALETIRAEAKSDRSNKIRRYVTIATPHAGVMWRGPLLGSGATGLRRGSKLLEAQAGFALKLPTLSIFSDHDNIVFPSTTASLAKRGGRDQEVEGLGHLAILFSPAVAEHVAAFLLEDADAAPAPVVVPEPHEAAEAAADAAKAAAEKHESTAKVAAAESNRNQSP